MVGAVVAFAVGTADMVSYSAVQADWVLDKMQVSFDVAELNPLSLESLQS